MTAPSQPTWRSDRGAIATETALVFPMLIVLLFLPIQFAFYWHGTQAAGLAAEECANAAAEYGNSAGDGQAAGWSILDASGALTADSVTAGGTDLVTCTVSGTLAYTIIGSYTITSTAQAARERLVTP
jgi:Flp pilus assembly protein TadG